MLSGLTQFCGSIGCGASPPPNRSADADGASSCHGCCCGQWSYRHGHSGSAADAVPPSSSTTTVVRNVASLRMAPSRSAALPLRGIVRLLSGKCVVVALPIFGAFVLGLGARRWLQRYFAVLFRAQFALGMGLLAALSGWSFDVTLRNVAALAVLLVAQVSAVVVAERLFRDRTDGPLIAFGMFGNPTFWSLPVAAVTLGAGGRRVHRGVRHAHAAADRARGQAAAHARARGAVAEQRARRLRAGRRGRRRPAVRPARRRPRRWSRRSSRALGIAMSLVAALLLGVAWPREWIGAARRSSRCAASRST